MKGGGSAGREGSGAKGWPFGVGGSGWSGAVCGTVGWEGSGAGCCAANPDGNAAAIAAKQLNRIRRITPPYRYALRLCEAPTG